MVVGIDLGTTVSVLALWADTGGVEFARTRDGGTGLRSVVMVEGPEEVIVGEQAVRAAALAPEASFAVFKRLMGEEARVEFEGRSWTPVDLSAEVLRALAEDAAATFGQRPERAVITIPAYFGDDARRATRDAAEQAGIEPVALIHEPTAACLAYGGEGSKRRTVLVYDLGGGTFDVSIVSFREGEVTVLATAGDHRLGGRDWDGLLVELIVEKLAAMGVEDPRDDDALLEELMERGRDAKHMLSGMEIAAVQIPTDSGFQRVEVSRKEFEARGETLFNQAQAVVEAAISDAGGAGEVDEVLLVGGSSRMPRCTTLLEEVTGLQARGGIDSDLAVARGAAIAATSYSHGGPLSASAGRGAVAGMGAGSEAAVPSLAMSEVREVTPFALGFVVVSGDGSRYINEVMIERNSPIPTSRTKRLTLQLRGRAIPSLEIHMLQGGAPRPLDTQPLGSWTFEDIGAPHGGKSSVAVQVSYEYDGDGVAAVSARVEGKMLSPPVIDRADRDLRWTEEDPSARSTKSVAAALVIDTSGSMAGEKLTEAQRALAGFIDVLEEAGVGEQIALITFSNGASVNGGIGSSPTRLREGLALLSATGGTDMAAGIAAAGHELPEGLDRRFVVILTDGIPNDPSAAMAERNRLVREEISILARGWPARTRPSFVGSTLKAGEWSTSPISRAISEGSPGRSLAAWRV